MMKSLCQCGCGIPAPLWDKKHGGKLLVGQPKRFIYGHAAKVVSIDSAKAAHKASPSGKILSLPKTSPEYRAYSHAKGRCENPNHHARKNYGGRGIKFLFASFEDFLAEVGRRPTPAHSIDRRNNDGNYEAGNIRWATREQQRANQRKPVAKV